MEKKYYLVLSRGQLLAMLKVTGSQNGTATTNVWDYTENMAYPGQLQLNNAQQSELYKVNKRRVARREKITA